MSLSNRLCRLAFLFAVTLSVVMPAGTKAEEAVPLNAFATWNLDGVSVKSAPEEATLVGSLHGPVFVDSGQGPIYAGQIVCPGTLTVSLVDGSQSGEGVCVFAAKDGAEAYGRWHCSGYHMVGCKGEFSFTGGNGRLAGITGGSVLLIRGEILETAKSSGPVAANRAVGIMVWHELKAAVPPKE